MRSILRHRDSLVQMASSHVQHMQKSLDQRNLQLHHVISDITGVTGMTIIEAILVGERNPHTLAALRDGRVKASADTIAKSLVGDYRREHLFTLDQSLTAFRHYQKLIGECDREIEQLLEAFESKVDPPEGSVRSRNRKTGKNGVVASPVSTCGVTSIESSGWTSHTFQGSTSSRRKLFWQRSVRTSRDSPARHRLPPGSDSVRTTGLAGEKYCRSKHAR